MTESEKAATTVATVDEIQSGWRELGLRVGQLEFERARLEQENKTLRTLLERIIEHRQKSHSELVLLITGLISKLPINDVGVLVTRLMEHNTHVAEVCTALAKGKADAPLPQPNILKALDQTKRDLAETAKKAAEDLLQSDVPLETDLLRAVVAHPEQFYSSKVVRANRAYLKGQLPRERVLREFGEAALPLFNDLTTDAKRNPNPKPDEIMLGFKPEFETLLPQQTALPADKREAVLALQRRVLRSRSFSEQGRTQRNAFHRLSFVLDLLHYYENQNTETPDVVFAQRLPALIEQLVVPSPHDKLDEKLLGQAEELLAFIIAPDHRLMVINNIGKGGGVARTLKFVLRLRAEKVQDEHEVIAEFIRHLILPQEPPAPEAVTALLRLVHPEMRTAVVRAIRSTDRIRRDDAEALGNAVAKELGLTGLEITGRAGSALSPEVERQVAWDRVKDMIASRADPALIAAAFRDRLHAHYDAEELKLSWLMLVEADAISFIRIFCHFPYLADGRTDPIAQPVMASFVTRLTHEKYAVIYHKVVNSLKNMFKAKPDSPTLVNFLALVRWVDAEAAAMLAKDVGMSVMPH